MNEYYHKMCAIIITGYGIFCGIVVSHCTFYVDALLIYTLEIRRYHPTFHFFERGKNKSHEKGLQQIISDEDIAINKI